MSVARNVGAQAARGEIIAYTDDDCIADEDWLLYLVRGMLDQNVAAIGGPNITPRDDDWVAHCVAASPGNPSHVMLDDRRAEHVPGCNMAIRREVLHEMGGFDPQYRTAGDDVDVCWRLLDAGCNIGFAPGALVWHHRRCTVTAYLKQQKGYGRAEAMVQFKHPQRFGPGGIPIFHGVLYGDGAVGLPIVAPRIYHGQFGSAPFQTIYRQQVYGLRSWFTSLAWHAVAAFCLLLSVLFPWLWAIPAVMWSVTLWAVVRASVEARLPADAPFWCPLVMLLHLVQPVIRSGHWLCYRWTHKRVPQIDPGDSTDAAEVRRISLSTRDLYCENRAGVGREKLLESIGEERVSECLLRSSSLPDD